ncbi:MAG: ribonuclease P [Nanoarchaeota archaeon]|nr:ribonuclease P [Nanoarchaeota archaeon]
MSVQIAKLRIKKLFEEADKIFKKNKKLSNRYVEIARKIAMKLQLKMPKKYKRQYCKHCYRFLKNGVNARVRIHKSRVVIYCMECKKYTRIPLSKKK